MHPVLQAVDGDPSPLHESLLTAFVARVRETLDDLFEMSAIAPVTARLAEAWDVLPEEWPIHLMVSPAFFRELTACTRAVSEECASRVLALVLDETAVAVGPKHELAADRRAIWTPMGDACLYQAPTWVRHVQERVGSVLLLDFASPNTIRADPLSFAMGLETQAFTSDEHALVFAKVSQALEHIDRISPAMGVLVRNFTRSVVCRKTVAVQLGWLTEQDAGTIGEVRLFNPHLGQANISNVAELLSFESVRNFISTYEFVEGPFLEGPEDVRYRPLSPWTGQPILPGTFHAHAVASYALYRFACLEVEQLNAERGQRLAAVQRRNRFAAGFCGTASLSAHVSESGSFTNEALSLLDEAQALVRADVIGGFTRPLSDGAGAPR